MMGMMKVAPKAFASTIDLHIHFLRPVRAGPITVKARITNKGPSIMFAEADLYDLRGKIAAKATSALAITALRIKTTT